MLRAHYEIPIPSQPVPLPTIVSRASERLKINPPYRTIYPDLSKCKPTLAATKVHLRFLKTSSFSCAGCCSQARVCIYVIVRGVSVGKSQPNLLQTHWHNQTHTPSMHVCVVSFWLVFVVASLRGVIHLRCGGMPERHWRHCDVVQRNWDFLHKNRPHY